MEITSKGKLFLAIYQYAIDLGYNVDDFKDDSFKRLIKHIEEDFKKETNKDVQ